MVNSWAPSLSITSMAAVSTFCRLRVPRWLGGAGGTTTPTVRAVVARRSGGVLLGAARWRRGLLLLSRVTTDSFPHPLRV